MKDPKPLEKLPPFRRGTVELTSGRKEVNYRFINEDDIEMYDDNSNFIGTTSYKSLIASDKYYKHRGWRNLTGREIEEIWEKETQTQLIQDSVDLDEWDDKSDPKPQVDFEALKRWINKELILHPNSNAELFFELLSKSSTFAHKAHKELNKLNK